MKKKIIQKLNTEQSKKITVSILSHTIVILGALVFFFPIYFTFVASSFPRPEIFSYPPNLFPSINFVTNYKNVILYTEQTIGFPHFPTVFINSLIYAIFGTLGALLLGSTAGYAFAKYQFPGREPLFYTTIVTLAIPSHLIAIPLVVLLTNLGAINTYAGAILPTIYHPVAIFFMKQNIDQTIIDSLLDSGRINGANEFQIWYKIVLPLIKPGLAALASLMFLLKMNALFWPLILFRTEDMYTATIWLANARGGTFTPTAWEFVLPAAILATIPALVVFTLMQKHFVKGLLAGSVKE